MYIYILVYWNTNEMCWNSILVEKESHTQVRDVNTQNSSKNIELNMNKGTTYT